MFMNNHRYFVLLRQFKFIYASHLKFHRQQNKCYPKDKDVYLPISMLHSILAVANLFAHNNISQICYCGQISLQSAAVNCSFSGNLTPDGVTFSLLERVPADNFSFCVTANTYSGYKSSGHQISWVVYTIYSLFHYSIPWVFVRLAGFHRIISCCLNVLM